MLSKNIPRSMNAVRRARSNVLSVSSSIGTASSNTSSSVGTNMNVNSNTNINTKIESTKISSKMNRNRGDSNSNSKMPMLKPMQMKMNINPVSTTSELALNKAYNHSGIDNHEVPSIDLSKNLQILSHLNKRSGTPGTALADTPTMHEMLNDSIITMINSLGTKSKNMGNSRSHNSGSGSDSGSHEFYMTMHNVLMRSNTPMAMYNRIMSSAISTTFNDFDSSNNHRNNSNSNGGFGTGNSPQMIQYRQFSTSGPSSKSDEMSTTTTTTKSGKSSSLPDTTTATIKTPPKTLKKDATIQEKAQTMLTSIISSLTTFISKIPGVLWFYITHPKEFKQKLTELKEIAKKEAHHYYMGSKLLMADLKTARQILGRLLQGSTLTRRERKQFIRTVTDVFRLVPMSVFVLIPFMEFALPFALKLFPNMLPSTFQDSLKAEENMKRELKSRIAMAEFFQETLQDLAKGQRKTAATTKEKIKADDGPSTDLESTTSREETATSFLEFIEKARKGEFLPTEVIIRYSSFFKDELTLDNMPRMQLINMCKYMSIPPYGNDHFLRFQLRHKIRVLQEDDQRILWEGIDSLTKMELREACQERGMRSTGMSKDAYKRSLQQWIDLSVSRNVPISLLIMSRTFFLREEMTSRASVDTDGSKSVAGLADAISGLEREVVNEVILESVTPEENKSDPELLKLKLEVLKHQNEMIKEEKEQREAADAQKAKHALEKQEMQKEEEAADEQTAVEAEEVKKDEVQSQEDKIITPDAVTSATTIETASDGVQEEPKQDSTAEKETEIAAEEFDQKEEEEENTLSSEEIDAISQLVSPDPVSEERKKLEKIKAAMQAEEECSSSTETDEAETKGTSVEDVPVEDIIDTGKEIPIESFADDQDKEAAEQIAAMDEKSRIEADSSTVIFMEGEMEKEPEESTASAADDIEDVPYTDEKLEKAIAGLKSKVENMVGNIEEQLSNVEEKIGDKLHFLDKDMDGILSREEMALCLQKVLKRPLTLDEAMAIAADMDENEDGYFSVDELSNWLETNKIVKLVEEGRDTEVDEIIAYQANKMKDEDQKE